jgi:hypothetical protein
MGVNIVINLLSFVFSQSVEAAKHYRGVATQPLKNDG